ncbi:hypothetical protein AVEN_170117-1 [Araneus ventricosus]|uniref:Tf2-1-like SH3-like domain-containing protein n=1 Tax=Araneus ventricosus TaxID=182803 RepID=A0A4Y2QTX0_ARAVE|nr:hypothetical protein AVEN_170117-1 [Araneus ventricosus]
MEKSQQRNKTWYDKRAVKREFQEGDSVLIFSNCRANKLSPRWTGPGTILKKLSETNYVVSLPHKKDKSQVDHVNMLKPYYKRPEQINYLSLEAEEGIGVDELEIPHVEHTPNVLDLSEIIPEPTGTIRIRMKINVSNYGMSSGSIENAFPMFLEKLTLSLMTLN